MVRSRLVRHGPNLFVVALHEIGHALGLSHSSRRGGTMYPYATPSRIIDEESRSAINLMYGSTPAATPARSWNFRQGGPRGHQQQTFRDHLHSPHALERSARRQRALRVGIVRRMDAPAAYSRGWSSDSPSVAPIPASGAGLRNGLMMACKVFGDQGLIGCGTRQRDGEPHHRIPSAGSSCRPAIANVNGNICMACKGIQDYRE